MRLIKNELTTINDWKSDSFLRLGAAVAQGARSDSGRTSSGRGTPARIEAARSAGMHAEAIASTHTPDQIARQLGDIQVESVNKSSLVYRLSTRLNPYSSAVH